MPVIFYSQTVIIEGRLNLSGWKAGDWGIGGGGGGGGGVDAWEGGDNQYQWNFFPFAS